MTEEQLQKLGYSNEEELLAKHAELAEKANKVSEFEGKVGELETKYNSTLNEFNTYKETVKPVANEFVAHIDSLARKGLDKNQIKEAINYIDLDPETMKPEEVVKTAYKFRTPGVQDNHAEAYYRSKFYVDPDDESVDEQTKVLKEAELITSANADRAFLKDFIGKKFTAPVDVQRQEMEQKTNKLTTFWSAQLPEIVKNSRKIEGTATFTLPGGKGPVEAKADYAFELPEERISEYQSQFLQSAVRGGVADNEEGVKQMSDFVKQRIIADNFKGIQEAERIATNNMFVDFMVREFNVKLPEKHAGAGGGGTGGTNAGSYEEQVFAHMGKKKQN